MPSEILVRLAGCGTVTGHSHLGSVDCSVTACSSLNRISSKEDFQPKLDIEGFPRSDARRAIGVSDRTRRNPEGACPECRSRLGKIRTIKDIEHLYAKFTVDLLRSTVAKPGPRKVLRCIVP
jgi:hypothetical protein